MSAGRRWLTRHGRDATLFVRDPATADETDLDEYGDPVATGEDAGTSTKAVVRFRSSERVATRAAGKSVEWDVEMIVPSDLAVDPEETEEWPRLAVGGEEYLVYAVDENVVDGMKRLLGARA